MDANQIRQLCDRLTPTDGITATGIDGLQLYRVSSPVERLPAVYTPRLCLNVSGSKRVFQNGDTQEYDERRFICCTMPLPVEADIPRASVRNPLMGISLEFNEQLMTEAVIEMSTVDGTFRNGRSEDNAGLIIGELTEPLLEALIRLLQLVEDPVALKVLAKGRLKEVYFALLRSGAGSLIRHRFGESNQIASTICFLKDNIRKPFSIDQLAEQAGMSRAVFHRRFKDVTTLSPIQFVKSLRLNTAAMHLAAGLSVNEAASQVGYGSLSQFSREFKRQFGVAPREWRQEVAPVI